MLTLSTYAAACGARSTLPDLVADEAAGGGGAECATHGLAPRSIAVTEAMPGWAEIDGLLLRTNGLLVWGAGLLPECGTASTFGSGTHFIALLSKTGELVWQQRFTSEFSEDAIQITPAPDGGTYALVVDLNGAFAPVTPGGFALVHFGPGGEIEKAVGVAPVDGFATICSSELTGRVLVAGRCSAPTHPDCPSTTSERLAWFAPDLTEVAVDELSHQQTGIIGDGVCAFDGEDAVFAGPGFGSFTFENAAFDLGMGGTLVARIAPDHSVVASTVLAVGSPHQYAIATDSTHHDVVLFSSFGSQVGQVTRLAQDLSTEWAQTFDGSNVYLRHLGMNAAGEALIAVRYEDHPLEFGGHVFSAPSEFGSRHAAAAVDATGTVTWALDDSANVLTVVDDAAGNHYIGGGYSNLAPPDHGGPWPLGDPHGFFVGIPAE